MMNKIRFNITTVPSHDTYKCYKTVSQERSHFVPQKIGNAENQHGLKHFTKTTIF
jgi:hypothetical protein